MEKRSYLAGKKFKQVRDAMQTKEGERMTLVRFAKDYPHLGWSTIAGLEAGSKRISAEVAYKLARFMGMGSRGSLLFVLLVLLDKGESPAYRKALRGIIGELYGKSAIPR